MGSEFSSFAICGYYNTRQPIPWFYMPGQIEVRVEDGSILDMYWNCIFNLPITNRGGEAATQIIRVRAEYDGQMHRDYTQEISLNPGHTYLWNLEQWADFRRLGYYKVTVTGDWPGNNYAEGVARL